ncbi:MAG: hypothetical protein FD174_451 [Geobacteraceae bacterium]|nr:MAG: hypothetical protein FD174_451 [Geobacteraceae bacterium]
MKRRIDLSALLAVLAWGASPVYADDGGMECFGSVFFIVFLAYCALIVVSHLVEFLRLRLFRKGEPAEGGLGKAFEEG